MTLTTPIMMIQRMMQVQWTTTKLDTVGIGSLVEHSIRRVAHTSISITNRRIGDSDPATMQLALVVAT